MGRRNLLSWGGAILTTAMALGGGLLGCGGSADPRANDLVGGPGQTGTGGAPPTAGTGGAASGGTSAAPGSTIFAQSYGDAQEQSLAGLAIDGKGNLYVAGNETIPNTASLTPPSVNGVFLLQYGPTGQLMWRQPFVPGPDAFQFQVYGVAAQPTTGLEILLGSIGGSVTIGGTKLSSGVDPQSGLQTDNLWLTAIDSAGYLVWTRLYQSTGSVFPDQAFTTGSGDIEVAGGMTDNASVGGAPLCCGNVITGPRFAARFSPTGDPIWSTGVTGYFRPVSAGADADGGMTIGGFAEGPFGYQGESFSSGGGPYQTFSGVVLRLDPQGQKRWIRIFVNSSGTSLVGATPAEAQNVVVYGEFSGPFDAGGGHVFSGPATTANTMDGVFAKLGPDGSTVWAQQIPGGLGQQFGAGIATDPTGNIAFSNIGDGTSAGPSFGGTSPLPPASFGHFVVKLGPDGSLLWTRGFDTGPGGGAPPMTGVAFDPSGRIGVAGDFNDTVDFGTGPMTAPGQPVHNGSGPEFIPDNVFTLLLAP